MIGREYGKGLDRCEFLRFAENVHEHLSSLFSSVSVVHVFCVFALARDIHEVIIGEQDRSIIHAHAVGFGNESMKACAGAMRTAAFHRLHLGNTLQPTGQIRWLPIHRIGVGEATCSWSWRKMSAESGYPGEIQPGKPFV
jgi:hypothetical protein